jgi:O-antigen/teichoic acid export membrane protein
VTLKASIRPPQPSASALIAPPTTDPPEETTDGTVAPGHHQHGRLAPSASIMRGALALLSTQPLTWSASLLTTIAVPHFLGASGLGEFALAWTVATLGSTVATLGMPGYVIRRVALAPADLAEELGAAFALVVATAFALAVLLGVALPLVAFPISSVAVLWLAMVGMVFSTAQMLLSSILMGQERHARFAWLNAAGVVLAALSGVGVLVLGGGVVLFVTVNVVTAAAVALATWKMSGVRIVRSSFSPSTWRRLMGHGYPFLATWIATRVYGDVDKVLLALLTSETVIGWYAAAWRIISIQP